MLRNESCNIQFCRGGECAELELLGLSMMMMVEIAGFGDIKGRCDGFDFIPDNNQATTHKTYVRSHFIPWGGGGRGEGRGV